MMLKIALGSRTYFYMGPTSTPRASNDRQKFQSLTPMRESALLDLTTAFPVPQVQDFRTSFTYGTIVL